MVPPFEQVSSKAEQQESLFEESEEGIELPCRVIKQCFSCTHLDLLSHAVRLISL